MSLCSSGVVNTKTSLVKKLLLSARGEEVRFVVRILVANLRIGAVRLTLLTALSRAFCLVRPGGVGGTAKKEEDGEGDVKMDEDDPSFWVTEAERSRLAALEDPTALSDLSASPAKGKGKAKKVTSKPASKKTSLELDVEARFVQAEKVVRRVYARHPNMEHLVDALKTVGIGGVEEKVGVSVGTFTFSPVSLDTCTLLSCYAHRRSVAGIPLEPMLGSITRSLADVYTKLGNRPFVSESKLDGQRGQIHVFVTDSSSSSCRPAGVEKDAGLLYSGEPLEGLEGKRVFVRTFSRHLEDMSEKYPDIVGTMAVS
jgi:DNA ligase-1